MIVPHDTWTTFLKTHRLLPGCQAARGITYVFIASIVAGQPTFPHKERTSAKVLFVGEGKEEKNPAVSADMCFVTAPQGIV